MVGNVTVALSCVVPPHRESCRVSDSQRRFPAALGVHCRANAALGITSRVMVGSGCGIDFDLINSHSVTNSCQNDSKPSLTHTSIDQRLASKRHRRPRVTLSQLSPFHRLRWCNELSAFTFLDIIIYLNVRLPPAIADAIHNA